ncbi:MAG: hypothetical protein KatS3mg100_558 [Candidatus Parcubacteria bacterium]|nr:MAG: hypothetical protein KatS3mg100_558 [Candidatus Parcubacteria bacterium]
MAKGLFPSRSLWLWVGAAVVVIGAPLAFWAYSMTQPHPLDPFAQCLADRGATFYGAFWCPHCGEQKAMFGRAQRLLPYVECSPPTRQGQYPVCEEAGVRVYPTWIFADGTRAEGVLPLNTLSERTGCPLSEGYVQ